METRRARVRSGTSECKYAVDQFFSRIALWIRKVCVTLNAKAVAQVPQKQEYRAFCHHQLHQRRNP
jgi:hypothetical protein